MCGASMNVSITNNAGRRVPFYGLWLRADSSIPNCFSGLAPTPPTTPLFLKSSLKIAEGFPMTQADHPSIKAHWEPCHYISERQSNLNFDPMVEKEGMHLNASTRQKEVTIPIQGYIEVLEP